VARNRNRNRNNPSHHREIARVLARKVGIGYQAALQLVQDAHRSGDLPRVLDVAGIEAAIQRLVAAFCAPDTLKNGAADWLSAAPPSRVSVDHDAVRKSRMARLDPEVAASRMRERGAEPLVPYPGTDVPWLCLHVACGREVTPRYASVVLKGQGPCFYCGQVASSKAAADKRRLDPAAAAAAMRERGAEPLEPFPGANTPWRCRCLVCHEEITPWYSSVVSNGNGACRYCSGTERLTEEAARAEMNAKGLEPIEPYPGNNVPWLSQCTTCRRTVSPTLSNVRKTLGCKYCSKRATDPKTAVEDMKRAGYKPMVPFPEGGVKARWLSIHLECGKEVSPTLDKISSGFRPCPHCSNHGYNAAMPAIVYLVVNDELGAAKIGICNEGSRRLVDHQRLGWTLARSAMLGGREAPAVEAAVLRIWRVELMLPIALGADDMPQGGWTETMRLKDRSLKLLLSDLRRALDSFDEQAA
jgi:hypothetical protein